MDASDGLLMAVKQVELPTGSAVNESRKKSMLTALEREIEFLQDLQHENIVQYLCAHIFANYILHVDIDTIYHHFRFFA